MGVYMAGRLLSEGQGSNVNKCNRSRIADIFLCNASPLSISVSSDLASRECDLSHSPFLQCIAKREEGNRGGFDSVSRQQSRKQMHCRVEGHSSSNALPVDNDVIAL